MNNHAKALHAQRRKVGKAQYDLLILVALKRAEDGLHKKFGFQWHSGGQAWYDTRIVDDRLIIYERDKAVYGVQVDEAVTLRERLANE